MNHLYMILIEGNYQKDSKVDLNFILNLLEKVFGKNYQIFHYYNSHHDGSHMPYSIERLAVMIFMADYESSFKLFLCN